MGQLNSSTPSSVKKDVWIIKQALRVLYKLDLFDSRYHWNVGAEASSLYFRWRKLEDIRQNQLARKRVLGEI